jgi:hypothetical protein
MKISQVKRRKELEKENMATQFFDSAIGHLPGRRYILPAFPRHPLDQDL